MITITDVHKTFNKGKANQVNAVNGITLEIKDGEFLVIVGSNGSGKTTLLNLIAGSVSPDNGTISIDGNDVTNMPDYKRSRWIARVFQNPLSGTAPDLSILDNFRLASIRTKRKGLSVGVNDTFKKQVREKVAGLGMGLQDKIDQPMGTLSGGQRQALTLLMSVMDSCKVLLLDEPTAALDPRSADVVMRTADTLIREFNLTAVFITHNLKDAFNYGTRIIQMGEGLIINDLSGTDKASLKQNDLFDWFA
ncbi:ATP-binding cassette domain-containing protein [Mucilaginibacter rubeus]|uniref:ATP-binding cassette domain-containing protein n=1 Tax=Mucilaginibacter rubeus TaxID=2027860 RepID=A0AAE6JCS8_9SPHI|nr:MULTISPECIES: ATP-binding cassette domain-containing protein [Mucilaginibacter]QEM03297.1 ATP-binding cassette domain-containing protein [Mucilaginibacter rubeus]QEM15915.1 ATP-binding cassette domain-containing protein [Mucilaginibacter gossypii]QTE41342.1 ATP-binding cassette domain-containing protein [Mucilaginibacter rubeus]QTE47946.1 ATP-binding cassette domain-containing protein [Mucilaginibacter rubeus]QTE59339.1 ATP-binding cassette domain-containing protein [Mucilaginibacter rubeus